MSDGASRRRSPLPSPCSAPYWQPLGDRRVHPSRTRSERSCELLDGAASILVAAALLLYIWRTSRPPVAGFLGRRGLEQVHEGTHDAMKAIGVVAERVNARSGA